MGIGGGVFEGSSSGARSRGATDVIHTHNGVLNKTLRIYPDGLRVGCTFVTKEAFELIMGKWNDREIYDSQDWKEGGK